MPTHETTVIEAPKGTETYRWQCTCGRTGRHGYGYRGLAEQAGNAHVRYLTDRKR